MSSAESVCGRQKLSRVRYRMTCEKNEESFKAQIGVNHNHINKKMYVQKWTLSGYFLLYLEILAILPRISMITY